MANEEWSSEEARAFAPGHVTGLFAPVTPGNDVRAWGSVGLGIVLNKGARVRARARKGSGSSLQVHSPTHSRGLSITEKAVRGLWDSAPYPGSIDVEVVHELPVARGLGMSAAGTLAASLAVAKLLHLPESAAVVAAHTAEVEGHGGLGGVPAILGGGVEVRRTAGIPPFGKIERTPFGMPVLVACLPQPLESPPLLGDAAFLAQVTRAAQDLLDAVPSPPVPTDSLMQLSSRFTERLSLATPPLKEGLDLLRHRGIVAAQAMLGNTLFTIGYDLEVTRKLEEKGFTLYQLRGGASGAALVTG